MDVIQIEEKAFGYHQSGFHCAEAVSMAILDFFAPSEANCVPKAATAFGGGMGLCKEETCGALSGGVLAIGMLFGREKPGAEWKLPADLAVELRNRFIKDTGASRCSAVLNRFGEQENMMKCKRLSGRTARMLAEILLEKTELGGKSL